MKLVTSSTALFRWGPDHRFKTELYLPAVYASQPYDIGVLRGDVLLKGYGDPSLSTPSFQKNSPAHRHVVDDHVREPPQGARA